MRFKTEIEDYTVIRAARTIEVWHRYPEFLDRVRSISSFNYNVENGHEVAENIILSFNTLITIKPYKTFNPFSSVIGYASDGVIYVNTRKLNLPLKERVQNLFHESLHIRGYSHKGNKNNEYNRNTVPYKVAKIFADYCEEKGYL